MTWTLLVYNFQYKYVKIFWKLSFRRQVHVHTYAYYGLGFDISPIFSSVWASKSGERKGTKNCPYDFTSVLFNYLCDWWNVRSLFNFILFSRDDFENCIWNSRSWFYGNGSSTNKKRQENIYFLAIINRLCGGCPLFRLQLTNVI